MKNMAGKPRNRKFAVSGLMLGTLVSASGPLGTVVFAQTTPNFGPNVFVYDQSTPAATIQAKLNSIANETQFSTNRYAVLFKPGTYNVTANVGFYEDIEGLGLSPNSTVITGALQAQAPVNSNGYTDDATNNFWRTTQNLDIRPATGGATRWAVSQGAPLRRMHIEGSLNLDGAYYGNASGGYIADTQVEGFIGSYSQQQWYTRDSAIYGTDGSGNHWTNGVWNQVFSGVINAPATSYPTPNAYTTLPTTPVSREKPFLYVDSSGNYNVYVPTVKTNSSGTTWASGGNAPGYSVSISNFFIAQPSNTADQINTALASGKSLILTPGIYQLNKAINVTHPNTIVLGLGYATLVANAGTAAVTVADVDGVQVAGLLVDAGPTNSPVLFEIGNPNGSNASHASNPTSINDVFFRVGGATAGSATTTLQIDSNNVITDDIWAWRADHGAGSAWTGTTDAHGLVVNGNNVTALGLAVEHYEKEQVLWNGNGGETIFYQSELPYAVPSQGAWMDGSANGYPSYAIANTVCTHQAYGLGIYSYFDIAGLNIIEDNAITVPNATGIAIHDAGTVWLAGNGSITHVINGQGAAVNSTYSDKVSGIPSFVGSGACTPAAPPTSPTTAAIAINAGGGATGSFVADTDVSGGSLYSNGQTVSVAGVTNAAPAAVYQDEREGIFTYTVPGFTPGSTHTVRLHFAELYFSNAGQRVFNVAINGKGVLPNFDIVAAAGGNFKAVVESVTAVANSSGQIVINFTAGSTDQPTVSGIEVQ